MPQGARDVIGKKVLVALGSNAQSRMGNAQETIKAALQRLTDRFGPVTASSLYETPAFPAGSGPDFINAACLFYSNMPPNGILDVLHQIEADFGRERTLRWGMRTLDLDIIAISGLVRPDVDIQTHWRTLPIAEQTTQTPDTLILPHPRVQDRAFVLVPMMDIAPDWVHPALGLTVTQMLAARPEQERAEIRPV